MSKRKAISKKTRFEVFKRDRFTCQYCGEKAPDVVLNIDHIKPVDKGGTNGIINLVTACFPCNNGKGPNELTDDSVIIKQRAELDALSERRQQLEMMMEWREEFLRMKEGELKLLCEAYENIVSPTTLTPFGIVMMRKYLRRFDIEMLLGAVDISSKYLQLGQDGNFTQESLENMARKIGGIAFNIKNREGG